MIDLQELRKNLLSAILLIDNNQELTSVLPSSSANFEELMDFIINGLIEEECLALLSNPSIKNISLYDQMASSIDGISREKIANSMGNK